MYSSICLLNSSSHPLPFGTLPVSSCTPSCLRSKLLPASRPGAQCLFAPGPAQCTHHRATRPAPRTPLAPARFPQLRQLGVGPGHAILCTHVHGVKWAQDMMLLLLLLLLLYCCCSHSPTHSLLRERVRERSRLLYEQIASERLKRTQSTYTYPSQHFLHNCHPPFHRSYATSRQGTYTVLSHHVFLLRQHRQ